MKPIFHSITNFLFGNKEDNSGKSSHIIKNERKTVKILTYNFFLRPLVNTNESDFKFERVLDFINELIKMNGGLYGDFGLVKSTRVLENRRYAEEIFKKRVNLAEGGSAKYTLSILSLGTSFFVFTKYFSTIKNLQYASLGVALLAYKISPFFFGNQEELSYLRNNKSEVIEELNTSLLNDYKERMGIFPSEN